MEKYLYDDGILLQILNNKSFEAQLWWVSVGKENGKL